MLIEVDIIDEIIQNRLVTLLGLIILALVIVGVFKFAIDRLWKKMEGKLHIQSTDAKLEFEYELRKKVAENVQTAIVVSDREGNIVYINKGTTNLLHYSELEMIGKPVVIIVPPESVDRHKAGMENWRDTGVMHNAGKPMPMHVIAKGGIRVPVEITIDELPVLDKVLVIGKLRDRTRELKQIELLASKVAFYEKVELIADVGFFDWDYINDKVYMTPGMLEIFDFSPEINNCSSAVILNCIISTDKQQVGEILLDAVNKQRSYEVEYNLKTGKKIRSIGEMMLRVTDDNKRVVMGIIGAVRQIKRKSA